MIFKKSEIPAYQRYDNNPMISPNGNAHNNRAAVPYQNQLQTGYNMNAQHRSVRFRIR